MVAASRHWLIVLVVVICLGGSGARQPALAQIRTAADARFALYMVGVGSLGVSALAYYFWKNSPAERAKGYREELGPGEWYLGAYTGLSYLPAADWKFLTTPTPELRGHTLKNVVYQPAILGGVKFGRYFDSVPWFGLEFETNFSRNALRSQEVRVSPPLPAGQTRLAVSPDRFYFWDMQVNLLARYGFLKDKEVTFGRLQPYIGVGPGFEVIYGATDSAKNLAIEALAGIRYMFNPTLALFCEYKFSYQFQVEYEQFTVNNFPRSTMTFDVPHHRIVLGVSYHFKNLYGN